MRRVIRTKGEDHDEMGAWFQAMLKRIRPEMPRREPIGSKCESLIGEDWPGMGGMTVIEKIASRKHTIPRI